MDKTNRTADALAKMLAAEEAHGALLASKFAAVGKSVGMYAPELAADADLIASHKAMRAAGAAYAKVAK